MTERGTTDALPRLIQCVYRKHAKELHCLQSGGPVWMGDLAQKPEYRHGNANRRNNQTAELQQ